MQALEDKKKRIEEKEKELQVREKAAEKMEEKVKVDFKENMYSKINISVKTMNISVVLLFIAVFTTLVMGFIARR